MKKSLVGINLSSSSPQQTIVILVIAVISTFALLSATTPQAHAAIVAHPPRLSVSYPVLSTALPSTVTAGYTYCNGACTVGPSGTTLSVDQMTRSASLAGNVSAVFETYNMVLEGTLAVDVARGTPNSNGARLVVLIVNGSGVGLTNFVVISGALAMGSSVTVRGGRYQYAGDGASLLVFNGGLTLSRASSVTLQGAQIIHANAELNATALYLVRCVGGDLTLSEGSSVSIDGNEVAMTNVTISGRFIVNREYLFEWAQLHADASVRVTGGSQVAVTGNTYALSDMTGWMFNWVAFNISGPGLYLEGGSTANISGNGCDVSTANLTAYPSYSGSSSMTMFQYLFAQGGAIQLTDGSAVMIANNAFQMVGSDIYSLSVSHVYSVVLSLNSGSSLSTTGNTHTVRGTTDKTIGFRINFIADAVANVTVFDGSSMSTSHNVVDISDGALYNIDVSMFVTSRCAIIVQDYSKLSIASNVFIVRNIVNAMYGMLTWNGLASYVGSLFISESSIVDLSHNQFTVTDTTMSRVQLWMYRKESYENTSYAIQSYSTLSVSKNAFLFTNLNVSSIFTCSQLYSSSGQDALTVAGPGSQLLVQHNTFEGTVVLAGIDWASVIVNLMYLGTDLLVDDGAEVVVAYNSIRINDPGDLINLYNHSALIEVGGTSHHAATISTCRNYMSGYPCVATNQLGNYNCTMGAGADSITAHECTRTMTVSPITNTTTPPPKPSCDSALLAARRSEVPLFANVVVSSDSVRAGYTLTLPTTTLLNATYSLLLQDVPNSLSGLTSHVVSQSVAGNVDGFVSHLPTIAVTVLNASFVRVTVGATSGYEALEGEALEVFIPSPKVLGIDCDSSTTTRLLLGRIVVVVSDTEGTTPPAVATTVVGGVAVVIGATGAGGGGISSEQQGLSAVVMFSCADPKSRNTFGSYRALSPFAIFNSFAGVVLGNAIAVLGVLIIQLVLLAGLRCCRPALWIFEHMGTIRFPSFAINVTFALHTGTAFAASQLVSMPEQFEMWEVLVGGVAFVYSVLYPVFLVLHSYYRVERAYQEYDNVEWLIERKWPTFVVKYLLPQGIMFSPETRRAYGSYVSSYRAPAVQVWWTSFPTWTAIVIAIGGLFHPESVGGCQSLFIAEGLAFFLMAVVVVWRCPLRSTAASYLNAFAKLLMGAVMFSLAASLSNIPPAVDAVFMLGVIQTVSTIIRIVHSIICQRFDIAMRTADVQLQTVWSHIPVSQKSSKKLTQMFAINGPSSDLISAAGTRATEEVNEVDIGEGGNVRGAGITMPLHTHVRDSAINSDVSLSTASTPPEGASGRTLLGKEGGSSNSDGEDDEITTPSLNSSSSTTPSEESAAVRSSSSSSSSEVGSNGGSLNRDGDGSSFDSNSVQTSSSEIDSDDIAL